MDSIAFVKHLMGLAPEGETFLMVRQKPTLKDGQMQFHPDGGIKATWPAFLPTTEYKPGAWYGNTASFIVDRFEGGHVRASKVGCEFILTLVLDDVGDKTKTTKLPPLEPTWKMETSPDSWQWGYVFRIQPHKDEFSAAIVAIAEAGYTDRGAVNAVRNFRLPGSINLKPGKDNFAAVLHEFHPEREFTLEEILTAFDVVPGPVGSDHRPVRLVDDGNDDVMAWLSDKGLLLSNTNREGWAAVVCPNADAHTDGNPEGRYLPSTRAFCCYHGHCNDVDSRAFLEWVAAQGGPDHDPGLREELFTQAMDTALSKLKPTAEFRDVASEVVAEVERKELGRLEKADWFTRFAYIQNDDAYFDLQDRREIGRGTFNALFRHTPCKSINSGRKIEASVCFDEHRQAEGAHALVGVTYAAGEPIISPYEGQLFGNRWRNARPAAVVGVDVSPWLNHFANLVPVEAEREHVLNVMAYKLQHPERKINHAILHAGHPGSGKDTLWAPFLWAIGGESLTNVALVRNEELTSQWGYALESEVMVVNELRQADAKDRRALENTLKPIIAAPPEQLPVNRKGLAPYMALNRLFVLAFSNERMAITLPSNDRRWFVIWSAINRMDERDSAALWAWYRSGGMAAVAGFLAARDVSSFNPGAAPMMTEAKAIMIETSMSTSESFLAEMMRNRLGEFAPGAVGGPWQALCDRLTGQAPAGAKLPVGALLHAFREAGWVDCGLLKSRANINKKHVFCAPEMVNKSKTELRDLAQGSGPSMGLSLVK